MRRGVTVEFVDAMLARSDSIDEKIEFMKPRLALAEEFPGCTPARCCPLCDEKFGRKDAVLSVKGRGPTLVTEEFIHRRCLEGLFRFGIVDEQDAIDEFNNYRDHILSALA